MMNKIVTIITFIASSSLLINRLKAQEKYPHKENVVAQTIIKQFPATYFTTYDCTVVMTTDEITELPCNYLAITVGDNIINYHYGLRNDEDKLYSVSYGLPVEFPNNVFLIMMDLKGKEPLIFEARGDCQKQRISNNIDKLTCQALAIDGSTINGEVLVPSFNLQEIIRELQ
ncbi:hypothetical protein [Cyanobacterium sp. Dongsha4]|uniref:hypothetical protein n=1 Tax=Cyanobacterium sp. DS4 TaxID=2878255 RepID=UPI002E81C22D|nr:hypothetical protein [Cyanobacterium sp. Dongsha4]WVL00398.1 hypothetical protein Dongsha4_17400 [Cyanobacterium sp. Dongsha4]